MPSTTASWARPITSYEGIPQIFKEFIPQMEPFPYIIYSPPDAWGNRKTNGKLTCMYQDRIVVLEVMGKKVTVVCYWFKDINYIEQGTMLLYSWIGINGLIDDKLSVSIVEYNSVVVDLFDRIVKTIRQVYLMLDNMDGDQDLSKLEFLNKLNYKFLNYSHESILPGEKIIGTVYQPDISEKVLIVFKRTVTLAHLTILTDKEIIIIKNEELVKVKREYDFKHGGVWAYIPLDKIINMTINVNEKKGLLTLILFVKENAISLLFSLLKQQDLEVLRKKITAIIKLDD